MSRSPRPLSRNLFASRRRPARPRNRPALRVESLEARALLSTATIDAGNVVRTVNGPFVAADITSFDSDLDQDPNNLQSTTPDAQTVALLKGAGMQLLRLSDGSGADDWHFADAPPQFQVGTGLLANVASAAGADGLVTVDFGNGTPQEAAAYVAYLNGTAGDKTALGTDSKGTDWGTVDIWATLRGQAPLAHDDGLNFLRDDHPAPFGFTRFEVGNEVYFHNWSNAPAQVDPAQYVAFAKTFATSIQRFDPSASIGVGVGNPVEYDGLWNIPMLQQCAAQGFTPGFLSDHYYAYDGDNEPALTDADLLLHTVSDPNSVMPIHADSPRNWAGRAADYRKLLNTYLGQAASQVGLFCAEFNSDSDASNLQSDNLAHGLFVADAIGSILQTEYQGLIYWAFRQGYNTDVPAVAGISNWRTGADEGMVGSADMPPETGPDIPYPAYFAEELAGKMVHEGDQVVAASSDRADLAVYAVKQQDGHLDLLVINKSSTQSIDETFNLANFVPAASAQSWQYGQAEDNAQKDSGDGSASLTAGSPDLAVNANGGGAQFSLNIPAYTMMVLDLTPSGNGGGGGGGNAPVAADDSYNVPAGITTTITAVGGVLANDTGATSATLFDTPVHGSLSFNPDGSFTYTPNSGFVGNDVFAYLDTSGDGQSSNIANVVLHVKDATSPPSASPLTFDDPQGTQLVVPAAQGLLSGASDPNGFPLTASVVGLSATQVPGKIEVVNDGSFKFTPDPDFAGSFSFQFKVSDGVLSSGAATVTINVDATGPVFHPTADFDGAGKSDLGVFRPSTAQWLVSLPTGGFLTDPATGQVPSFGAPNLSDIPIAGDFDGDGHTDLGVFRPSTAQWIIKLSGGGFLTDPATGQIPQFGAPNLFDLPIVGDFDGDGKSDLGVFRPSTAQWIIKLSSGGFLTDPATGQVPQFGAPNLFDIPIAGDFDGDGKYDLGIFRPSTAQWIVKLSGGGFLTDPTTGQVPQYGATNLADIPVPGDYDGTGKAQFAVFRPGTAQWYIGGHAEPISFGAGNLFDLPLEGPTAALVRLGLVGQVQAQAQGQARVSASAALVATAPQPAASPAAPSPAYPLVLVLGDAPTTAKKAKASGLAPTTQD